MNRSEFYKRFEELHSKGSSCFGADWLSVNIRAQAAAESLGLDSSELEMKTLLSEVSYRILIWMNSDGEANNPS